MTTSPQHSELAAGRWKQLSFVEQMANVGSEIERCISWTAKGRADYSSRAFSPVTPINRAASAACGPGSIRVLAFTR